MGDKSAGHRTASRSSRLPGVNDVRPNNRRSLDTFLTAALIRGLGAGTAHPPVLVVTGEAGAGKSRALREALASVPAASRRAASTEIPRGTPYKVVSALLGLDLGRPVPADAEERLLARLDDLCAAGPLVLVVDDAHEADSASLALLNMMASAARDLPLALLVARRPRPERDHLVRLLRAPSVREVVLPPLDDIDLDALVHEHTGRWPGRRLRPVLAPHRDNALRMLTLLDGLADAGAFTTTGDVLELRPGSTAEEVARGGLGDPVASTVSALHGPARDAARILAVLGRPATVEEIAAVAGVAAVALVEPVQVLLDRAVAVFEPGGRLVFAHDSYRDAVELDIPGPLARVLHTAAARYEEPAGRVRHVIASGAPAEDVLLAVQGAEADLAHAPAVEADLLAGPVAAGGSSRAAVELAIRRSRALARSGRPSRAETVARTALDHATDPVQTVKLSRVLIFTLTLRGRVPEALALVDASLDAPVSGHVRDIIGQHRAQLVQLAGLQPLLLSPPVADPRELTLTGLVTEAVRLSLIGHPTVALELAWEASRQHMSAEVDPYEGASSDLWPPFVELHVEGPRAAWSAMQDVARLREDRSAQWQSVPHQLLRGSIDLAAGRLADAAAAFDAGLESADWAGLAWTSMSEGARALIDVLRGDLEAADTRLRAWHSAPAPLQFGIPQPQRAEVALLEARRRYREASRLAGEVWRTAAHRNLLTWLATVAPELARIARRAADEELRAMIDRDLARLPRPLTPALAPTVHLAEALTGTDADGTVQRACAAAEDAHRTGLHLAELAAWEEAAVAAAEVGDRTLAREYARHALRCAEETGATGAATRVTGRLRAAGVRLGATAARRRPATGWQALTPTETLVADLVASGRTGPEIARDLNVSTRTVQTHVSHALAKLGLASRIELAAAARARPDPPPR
ncbi:AAA ATPase domain-containing protein [Streptomyces sp. LamerLS-31b]|uniref:LuxR C-terminal-related transcriptional regulator n=1 Tax=Streptomyces griseofuscus TaxID=146922 RepID=UPI00081D87C9|nr:AAA ATPase domain-containing protein [Streptomyces sp. LamerLS-31b]